MRKLEPKKQFQTAKQDIISELLDDSSEKTHFIEAAKALFINMKIEFYEPVGLLLYYIGFPDTRVTREGNVNNRMDVVIVDSINSIPVEIKSPREDKEINIKSIEQACENKVILLSRRFHNTRPETTSMAVAFTYPPERSDVYELIGDIKAAYDFNIGIIDIDDLLSLVWAIKKEGKSLNYSYFNSFSGKFCYEKAIS